MELILPVVSRAGADLKRLLGEPKTRWRSWRLTLKVARNNLLLQKLKSLKRSIGWEDIALSVVWVRRPSKCRAAEIFWRWYRLRRSDLDRHHIVGRNPVVGWVRCRHCGQGSTIMSNCSRPLKIA